MKVLMLWIVILSIYIALGLACALWIGRRRRTGPKDRASTGWAAADPFFFPIGDCPTVPPERLMMADNFAAWGIPDFGTRSDRPVTTADLNRIESFRCARPVR